MKRILTLLIWAIAGLCPMLATPQIGGGLTVNGEQWLMYCWPMDNVLHNALREQAGIDGGAVTICWDGYTANWAIRDSMLVLDSIDVLIHDSSGDISFRPLGQDTIDAAFRSIGRTTRIATWYSGTFNAISGKSFSWDERCAAYHHSEREMVVTIENGKVVSMKTYHNRIAIDGFSFTGKDGSDVEIKKRSEELSSRFTFSADEFPELKGKRIAIKILEGDSSGNITDISIIKTKSLTLSPEREKELTARLLTEINKSAPWTTYYINGKYVLRDRYWIVPYRFQE